MRTKIVFVFSNLKSQQYHPIREKLQSDKGEIRMIHVNPSMLRALAQKAADKFHPDRIHRQYVESPEVLVREDRKDFLDVMGHLPAEVAGAVIDKRCVNDATGEGATCDHTIKVQVHLGPVGLVEVCAATYLMYLIAQDSPSKHFYAIQGTQHEPIAV